ncbi:ras guanine nucleotide exchange factor domain-containing protein [Zopfochytrium polystomum]|nr:ras guanine nucleotide exchange factor domain-containing protein [Zopfochytrium polystomum]
MTADLRTSASEIPREISNTSQKENEVYLRVHLPNDNTTVLLVDATMAIWEILNVIAVKKELIPSQHNLHILFTDGREEAADPDRSLNSYSNVDRVKVLKKAPPSNQAKQSKVSLTAKRALVVTAPSSRQQNVRVTAQEFPKTVTDHRVLSQKIAATESSSDSASTKKKSSKSLSVIWFKRSNSELSVDEASAAPTSVPSNLTQSSDAGADSRSICTVDSEGSKSQLAAGDDESTSEQDRHMPLEGVSPSVDGRSMRSISFRMGSRESSLSTIDRASMDSPTRDQDERHRKRAVSATSSLHSGSVMKKSIYRNGRSRSNTDSIITVKQGEKLAGGEEEKFAIVFVTMPNFRSVTVKAPLECYMDDILDHVCEKNNMDYDRYTLKLNDPKKPPLEMDRQLSHYVNEQKITEFFMAPGQKLYRTQCISEGDKDVMILQVIQGKTQVMAGTAEKLIDRLTLEHDQDDGSFLDTIMLTFRSFMEPFDFFQQLFDRYNSVLPPDPTPEDIDYFNKMKVPTQMRVLAVVQWWAENHWHDFAMSSDLANALEDFVYLASENEKAEFKPKCEELLHLMDKQKREYEAKYSFYKTVEKKSKSIESMLLQLTPEELSQQLCLHNFKLFNNIHPIEFLHQIWRTDEEGTPYLNFFIERFDKEYYWVATEILSQKDLKKRITVLKTIILAAKGCQENNNFFSLFAIIAGLSITPISRLKKTWEGLPDKVKATHADLEKIIDPSRNMKNYKDALAAASPPIIPFLPIYLKDLTFINDGNPSNVEGMINFDKLRMMGNRVKDITSFAKVGYKFEPNPAIQNYVGKPPIEKKLAVLKEMSNECEK